MKSLRSRTTIMIVLLVLGSSVLLSFVSYQRAKSSLISQLEVNYAVTAQKYALELTSWVNTNATIIDTLAAEIAVNDISQKGYDEFHNYLKHSNDLLNKNGYVYDVYFTYTNNFMVCASDFIADGTVDFVHEREWYTKSALTGELFFSAPYLDSDTGKPIITISKAVYRDDELLGVLAADIFVDVLVDRVKKVDVGEDSYAFLIDQNMRMIVHPNKIYDYEDVPVKVMDVPNSPYADLVDDIYAGYDGMVFVKDYDGITRGIVYSRMPNTGWYVCIATGKDEIAKGVSSLMRGFVIATAVSVLIGVLISIFLARVLDKLNRQEQEYRQRVLTLEKQAADEASEAKSRFLADMSHEIRTPINAIIGMNEMIFRESDNRDILEYSRNIRQSGHNLLQLINGILDFSKIEDGKMEIVPVHYNVATQVAYFVNSISERASAKNLQLNINVDPMLPSELYGDDTRINQVVMNLLTNAVKYTEEGSVTLTIEERDRSKDNNDVLLYFEVRDTGIGIKESDMAKLFESFERLDVVRNRNIEGTGLGMTITRRLLDLMGSELKVESKYGEGSVFWFELWQRVENNKPLGNYKKSLSKSAEKHSYKESFRAPDARILVVDDTNMNIFVVENLLKKTGIRIDTALSGSESIRLADENVYDVILMDQRMPGMDGTEAMRSIRDLASKLNEKTPIICLTADVIMGAKDRYLKQGFDDYLMKPIDGDMLEKMLMEYLPASKVMAGQEDAGEEPEDDTLDEGFIRALKDAGVDTDAGLDVFKYDESMYKMVLGSFVHEARNKSENLKKTYEEKDWKNYEVYAHSLKSGAKTIGAKALSEIAAGLEAAAGVEDISVIERDHGKAMKMYDAVTEAIRKNMEVDEPEERTGDSVILEFDPQ